MPLIRTTDASLKEAVAFYLGMAQRQICQQCLSKQETLEMGMKKLVT